LSTTLQVPHFGGVDVILSRHRRPSESFIDIDVVALDSITGIVGVSGSDASDIDIGLKGNVVFVDSDRVVDDKALLIVASRA
jgi:hypothetical protein